MINIPAIFFARSMGIDYPATNPTASNLIESLSKVDSINALGRSRLIFKGIDFSKSTTAKDALFKEIIDSQKRYAKVVMSYLLMNQPDYTIGFRNTFGDPDKDIA